MFKKYFSEYKIDIQYVSFGRIIRLAYPVILSMLSLNIMQFIDRMFVAQYNLTQFSAVMPASIFGLTASSVFLGLSSYVTALVSQYFGAKKIAECTKSMWQGIYFSLAAGLVLIFLAPLLAQIFQLLGHEPQIIIYEKQYFYFMLAASIFQLLINVISGFFNGLGDTRTPMITSILANILNIFFDWIFVFGNLGFPALGIIGAGIATLFSTIISLIVLVILLLTNSYKRRFRIFHFFHFNKEIFYKLIKFGFPAGIQFFLGIGSFSFFFLFIGKMGEIPLICANIVFTIEGLSFLPILGLSNSVGIIAGQEKGANRSYNIPRVVRNGIILALFYNLLMILLFNFFPEFLVSIFNSGKNMNKFSQVIAITVPLIHLTSIWLMFDSIQILISSVLKTLGDTLFLMIITGLLPLFLQLGPIYIMGVILALPLTWIWVSIIIFVVILAAVMTIRFIGAKWVDIEVI